MTTLREWEAHVRRNPTVAFCGAKLDRMMWVFQDIEHAEASVALEKRVQPCEGCMARLQEGAA